MSNRHYPLDTPDDLDLEEHEAPEAGGPRASRSGRRPSRDYSFDDDGASHGGSRMRRTTSRRDEGKEQRRRAMRTREEPVFEGRGPASRENGGFQRDRNGDRTVAQATPRFTPYSRPPQSTSPAGGNGRPSGSGAPYRPGYPVRADRPQYASPQSHATRGAFHAEGAQDGAASTRPYYPFKSSRPSPQSATAPREAARNEGAQPGRTTGTPPHSAFAHPRPGASHRTGPQHEDRRRIHPDTSGQDSERS